MGLPAGQRGGNRDRSGAAITVPGEKKKPTKCTFAYKKGKKWKTE
jgi:hypothetical protein